MIPPNPSINHLYHSLSLCLSNLNTVRGMMQQHYDGMKERTSSGKVHFGDRSSHALDQGQMRGKRAISRATLVSVTIPHPPP